MSTYAIGDIQGCHDSLQALLEKISFNPSNDVLWLTGDLVNRGPKSLNTLRFIQSLGSCVITVLGNHDIALLALANKKVCLPILEHTLTPILEAPDCHELIAWLKTKPLLYYDQEKQWLLVHAGLYPSWDLQTALTLAQEAESFLRSQDDILFYQNLLNKNITTWDPTLTGLSRFQFIIHCLTRIRFCKNDGTLDFNAKGSVEKTSPDLVPWFKLFHQNYPSTRILFGHWAALQGKTGIEQIVGLDTGCVWGRSLTALRLDDLQYFSVNCVEY